MKRDSTGMDIDMGILILRVLPSLMMLGHGWGKLSHFSEKVFTFPNPIGIGSAPSLIFTIFAEVFCSLAIILGYKTKWFSIPPLLTMLVAAIFVHGADPWSKKEFPLLYAVIYLALIFLGSGKYSLDDRLSQRFRKMSSL